MLNLQRCYLNIQKNIVIFSLKKKDFNFSHFPISSLAVSSSYFNIAPTVKNNQILRLKKYCIPVTIPKIIR